MSFYLNDLLFILKVFFFQLLAFLHNIFIVKLQSLASFVLVVTPIHIFKLWNALFILALLIFSQEELIILSFLKVLFSVIFLIILFLLTIFFVLLTFNLLLSQQVFALVLFLLSLLPIFLHFYLLIIQLKVILVLVLLSLLLIAQQVMFIHDDF